jgi:hypothetical protein
VQFISVPRVGCRPLSVSSSDINSRSLGAPTHPIGLVFFVGFPRHPPSMALRWPVYRSMLFLCRRGSSLIHHSSSLSPLRTPIRRSHLAGRSSWAVMICIYNSARKADRYLHGIRIKINGENYLLIRVSDLTREFDKDACAQVRQL